MKISTDSKSKKNYKKLAIGNGLYLFYSTTKGKRYISLRKSILDTNPPCVSSKYNIYSKKVGSGYILTKGAKACKNDNYNKNYVAVGKMTTQSKEIGKILRSLPHINQD